MAYYFYRMRMLCFVWISICMLSGSLLLSQSWINHTIKDHKFLEWGSISLIGNDLYVLGRGGPDIFLKSTIVPFFGKFDLNGNTQFIRFSTDSSSTIHIQPYDTPISMGLDSTFVYFATTRYYDNRGKILLFFLRMDRAGDTLAYQEYAIDTLFPHRPHPTFFTANDVATTSDGQYVLSVNLWSDIGLLKVDKNGQVLWRRRHGTANRENLWSIAPDTDGGVVVATTRGNWPIAVRDFVSQHYLFKVDALGDMGWEYDSGLDSLYGDASSLLRMPDGGWAYLSGPARELPNPARPGDNKLVNAPGIIKLDSNRNVEWEFRIPEYEDIKRGKLYGLDCYPDGSLVACGQMPRVIYEENGELDYVEFRPWILKLSVQGQLIWSRRHDLPPQILGGGDLLSVIAMPDGGAVFAGSGYYTDSTGPRLYVGGGLLIRVDSTGCLRDSHCYNTAIGPRQTRQDMQVYPNPAEDRIHIHLESPPGRETRLSLLDIHGRLLRQTRMQGQRQTWPLGDLPQGIYLLRLEQWGRPPLLHRLMVR